MPATDGFVLSREVKFLLLFFGMLVLELSCFGLMGALGKALAFLLFGLFGKMAYVFPIFLFLLILFISLNKGEARIAGKVTGAILLFCIVSVIFELFSANLSTVNSYSAKDIFIRCYEDKTGGGVILGSLTYFLYRLLKMAGTILLLIVLTIISVLLISRKSLVTSLRRGADSLSESRRKHRMRRDDEWDAAEDEEDYLPEDGYEEEYADENEYGDALFEDRFRNLRIRRGETESFSGVTRDTLLPRREEVAAQNEAPGETETVVPADSKNMHEVVYETAPIPSEEILTQTEDGYIEPTVIETTLEEEEDPETEIDIEIDPVPLSIEAPIPHLVPTPDVPQTVQKVPAAAVAKTAPATVKPVAEAPKQAPVTASNKAVRPRKYVFPRIDLLKKGTRGGGASDKDLKETAYRLEETLRTFGVNVTVTDISMGPAVTRYELTPEQGVKVSRIVSLQDDIKMHLAATDIRIEAPIPGKSAIGIEVPNKENSVVTLRDILESSEYKQFGGKLAFPVGKDIAGQSVVFDIAKMPHVLIAGATGSGKSVCINTIIMGILYKATPEEVKLILIDPKIVELSVYNGIPHLMIPVVTDPKQASAALHWAVAQMEERYRMFADAKVRDLKGYNALPGVEKLPQIVIIVDELADLMMVSANEVEEAICRLAQLARAAGIHLIIATQRPSVDVITGLIKANMPSRVAFAVTSGVDSRTILDMVGAEKLLGKGDMLFYPQGYNKPTRVQGAFVSDDEVSAVVTDIKTKNPIVQDSAEIEEEIKRMVSSDGPSGGGGAVMPSGSEIDEYFVQAGRFIIEKDKASIGLLQRLLKIGFNRAARIMDQLCEAGVVSAEEGTKARNILMTMPEFEQYIAENGL
ncbi:MAG: DNA translocase FtsK [Lachnospiraceae bacterium]|nr:DNA translocase FtsK [Lachnospiraceae bacterium]